jgi:hypothetical protein
MHFIFIAVCITVVLIVSCQLPDSFDKLIPNGILISESSDNVYMCKHTWRVFVSVRKPIAPKGYQKQANKMIQLLKKAIKGTDIHQTDK